MRTTRTLSLILVGVVVGAMLISPAGAHLGGLRHVIKHLKKTFYTQAEVDALFLTRAEADPFLTQAEAEAGFLPQGEIILSQAGPWMVQGSADVTMPATRVEINPTAGSDLTARLLLTGPHAVGVPYALRDVEICYAIEDGTGNDKIDSVMVLDFIPSGSNVMHNDDTDRTSTTFSPMECFTTTDPTPNVLTGSPAVSVFFAYSDDTTDAISFRSVTTTWVPA